MIIEISLACLQSLNMGEQKVKKVKYTSSIGYPASSQLF